MQALYKKRLAKLAKYLEDHDFSDPECTFGFATVTDNVSPKHPCGTSACAMGLMPLVDPDEWYYSFSESPLIGQLLPYVRLLNSKLDCIDMCAKSYFGISYKELWHLFYPNRQRTEKYGGKQLDNYATADEVAHNIRQFLKRK